MSERAIRRVLLVAVVMGVAPPACMKLDFFLFDSDPASLEDYDFSSPELDGIPPERITSEMVPVGESGESIHVIWVERDEAKLDPRIPESEGVTVIFSHGNSGNNLTYYYRVGYFEDMGFNVLLYDFRGYGASDGETTQTHVYEDVGAAYDWAVARPGVGRILSVGYSMGGAPAIWLCSPESGREVLACFTESAFASTAQLIHDGMGWDLPGSWFMDAEFDNEALVSTIDLPFMMMHGTLDQRVGFVNGEMLWDVLEGRNELNRFWIVEGAGHRNVPVPSYTGTEQPREYSHPDELPPDLHADFEVYQERIVSFVAECL